MSTMNAISGLLASSNAINVISNNIANASTVGFKSSTLSFCDVVSPSLNSRVSLDIGVQSENLVQNFNDGALMNTERDLDLGIQKNGFFRVLDSFGHVYYTRNGQFFIDKNKNIVNEQGMYLTGENDVTFHQNINYVHYVGPINLKKKYGLPAKATTKIELSPILNDASQTLKSDKNIPNYYTGLTIYDLHEQPKTIDITIYKKKDIPNTWEVYIHAKTQTDGAPENDIYSVHDIVFDSSGYLKSPTTINIFEKKTGSFFHPLILDLKGTKTHITGTDDINKVFQNGYPSGILKKLDVLQTGEILGTYSNEQKKEIGQIVLASFINPDKLQTAGSNLWSATQEAGKENLSPGNHAEFGTITKKTLEKSNVDLNKELINMIVAQRNYQSNAQVLKTEDKIIGTLVNLR